MSQDNKPGAKRNAPLVPSKEDVPKLVSHTEQPDKTGQSKESVDTLETTSDESVSFCDYDDLSSESEAVATGVQIAEPHEEPRHVDSANAGPGENQDGNQGGNQEGN
jgi:hypothetical protein